MAKKTRNTVIKGAIVIFALIFVISAVAFAVNLWDEKNGKFSDDGKTEKVLSHNGKDYVLRSDVETFLVIGLDKFSEEIKNDSFENDQMADFVTLFAIDNTNKKWSAIQLNRDTMVEFNDLGVAGNKIGTLYKQLAFAHNEGNGEEVSCRNVADAVSDLLLDIKVLSYMSVNMSAVEKYNDMVGGVEVEILDDFTGIDNELIKGETILLNGKQALTYVRERKNMNDSSNSARMKRQQQYLKALYEKTIECTKNDDGFIAKTALSLANDAVTNLSSGKLETLFKKLSEYEYANLYELEGESKVGEYMEFYPDENTTKDLVISLFYEEKKAEKAS